VTSSEGKRGGKRRVPVKWEKTWWLDAFVRGKIAKRKKMATVKRKAT